MFLWEDLLVWWEPLDSPSSPSLDWTTLPADYLWLAPGEPCVHASMSNITPSQYIFIDVHKKYVLYRIIITGKLGDLANYFKIANIKAKRWTHIVATPKTLN